MKKNIFFNTLLITCYLPAFTYPGKDIISYKPEYLSTQQIVAAVKPIALVYQASNETEPVGGWILNQTNNSIKIRAFHNNHDWEFTDRKDGKIDLKIGGDNFYLKKVVVANAVRVIKPDADLLHKNAYVSVLADGNIPTPAKITTTYRDGKNKGGSFSVQLPFSDGAKIIEISWSAFQGKWSCTKGNSSYIPVGININDIYIYNENNGEEILTNQSNSNATQGSITNVSENDGNEVRPAMSKIVFADSKEFYATVMKQGTTHVEIKIIPSGDIYSISKKGIIISSTGKYNVNTKVQSVLIKQAGQSIYNDVTQSNFDYGTLGLAFPDGKVQYAWGITVNKNFFSFIMSHSKFNYQAYYKNGEWKIDNAGGEYKNGTIIKDIFELDQNFKKWY